MTIDVKAECANAKKRIAQGTGDNRDRVMIALLDSTANVLLANGELYRKNEGLESQVRDLTRTNDMLATRLSRLSSPNMIQ